MVVTRRMSRSVGTAMVVAAVCLLGACTGSSDEPTTGDTPETSVSSDAVTTGSDASAGSDGTDTTIESAAPPSGPTVPRTPGIDPFPLPLYSAGPTGAEVCTALVDAVGGSGASTEAPVPDSALSSCTVTRNAVTITATLFPFDAYELAKANAYQVTDGDLEYQVSRRKAIWYAGPGTNASRVMVQMSDLSSLLIQRSGTGGSDAQRSEMTAIAEKLLPVFEGITPPAAPTTSASTEVPEPASIAPVTTTAS
jgi:hypothetical protein